MAPRAELSKQVDGRTTETRLLLPNTCQRQIQHTADGRQAHCIGDVNSAEPVHRGDCRQLAWRKRWRVQS